MAELLLSLIYQVSSTVGITAHRLHAEAQCSPVISSYSFTAQIQAIVKS